MQSIKINQEQSIIQVLIILSRLEFVLATINREKLMEKERLEMAFRMFDRDGSGTISTEEIKQLFGANTKIAESVF